MKFKKILVTIEGLPPGLLMNRFSVEKYKESTGGRLKPRQYDPEVEARNSAYMAEIDGKMQLYVPGFNVYTMILKSSGRRKIGKTSARGMLAGLMKILPDKIPLGTDKYEIDERRVVIGRASIIRYRACLPEWKLDFEILYESDIIANPYIIKDILEEAGYRMGLLDYRPQHLGPFGTFTVTRFEVEGEETGNHSQGTVQQVQAMSDQVVPDVELQSDE